MEKTILIPGYESLYSISESGKIFSFKSNRFIKSVTGSNDYKYIVLCNKGQMKRFSIHRLVALSFIPNPFDYHQVNHIDHDKQNNHVSNLEWCTQSENIKHSYTNPKRGKSTGQKGLFGLNHNRSKPIFEFNSDGILLAQYESGLDFQRKTGKHHSGISWSIKNKKPIFGLYYSRSNIFEMNIR